MMKVAIPTDDGLIVRQHFRGSRAFIVATVKEGMIVHQDLRWNLLSEILTSEHGSFYNLVDCDILIVNEIGNCQREILKTIEKEIIHTDQTEISKAFVDFMESVYILNEVEQTA